MEQVIGMFLTLNLGFWLGWVFCDRYHMRRMLRALSRGDSSKSENPS